MEVGISNQDEKQDPPLPQAKGWATLRVFMRFGCVEFCDLSMEELKVCLETDGITLRTARQSDAIMERRQSATETLML
jgi:hypothetical protein